jgi:hypothetical protein
LVLLDLENKEKKTHKLVFFYLRHRHNTKTVFLFCFFSFWPKKEIQQKDFVVFTMAHKKNEEEEEKLTELFSPLCFKK